MGQMAVDVSILWEYFGSPQHGFTTSSRDRFFVVVVVAMASSGQYFQTPREDISRHLENWVAELI